jgi:hypothetical protein
MESEDGVRRVLRRTVAVIARYSAHIVVTATQLQRATLCIGLGGADHLRQPPSAGSLQQGDRRAGKDPERNDEPRSRRVTQVDKRQRSQNAENRRDRQQAGP